MRRNDPTTAIKYLSLASNERSITWRANEELAAAQMLLGDDAAALTSLRSIPQRISQPRVPPLLNILSRSASTPLMEQSLLKTRTVTELLQDLVAINSVNPFESVTTNDGAIGIGNEAAVNYLLEQLLIEQGFTTQRQIIQESTFVSHEDREISVPERWNLLAEKGTGERSLLLFGHSDTVDVKEGWETDPFTLVRDTKGGRPILRGLGAIDMKGGLAAIISAVSRLHTLPTGWKIKIAVLADEEFWSFGADRLISSDFLSDVALAIVPEIGQPDNSADNQWLGVGRLGRCEFVFDIFGRACHGSEALVNLDSVNAVHQSVALQHEIIKSIIALNSRFGMEGIQVDGSAYISCHTGGKPILSVPDRAMFTLDRTFVPGESVESELRRLKQIIDSAYTKGVLDQRCQVSLSVRQRPTPHCLPYFFSTSSAEVKMVADCAQKHSKAVHFGIGTSVADENRIAALGIPTLILAPVGAGYHTCEEWVDEQSLYRIRDTLVDVVDRLPSLSVHPN